VVCISGLTARNAKQKEEYNHNLLRRLWSPLQSVGPHLLGRKAQEMLVQPTAAKEKKIRAGGLKHFGVKKVTFH